MKTQEKLPPIAVNRKARFDYFIEERFEAGISLMGWEVKSMRAGKAQIAEAYVYVKNGEAFLFGAHLNPLTSASTHVETDPTRTRKLLLNRRQLDHLAVHGDPPLLDQDQPSLGRDRHDNDHAGRVRPHHVLPPILVQQVQILALGQRLDRGLGVVVGPGGAGHVGAKIARRHGLTATGSRSRPRRWRSP